jgi:hypothetical protein
MKVVGLPSGSNGVAGHSTEAVVVVASAAVIGADVVVGGAVVAGTADVDVVKVDEGAVDVVAEFPPQAVSAIKTADTKAKRRITVTPVSVLRSPPTIAAGGATAR